MTVKIDLFCPTCKSKEECELLEFDLKVQEEGNAKVFYRFKCPNCEKEHEEKPIIKKTI